MNKRYLIAAVFAVILSAGVFAQAFSVSYLDGVAELQALKTWKALSIGDQVPPDARVRVSQSGSLELLRGKLRITILKDGVYDMASLAKATDKSGAGAIGTTIAQKLQSLTTEKTKASAVGGARGAEQGSGPVMWVDENDETRDRVQAMLDQKQYADALKVLAQAIKDSMVESEREELTYMMGVAYYGDGQPARAYRILAKLSPESDAAWYARYVILKSQVLVDSSNFKDALAILSPFVAAFPTGEATQVAYLLTYFSQKGLGDQASASAALEAGFQLDPTSDTAKLIDQQRKAQ
jgi:tetratricopeptide (TPR) repeat protein